MPNPRAQRQLTLDRVVSDLKSFAEPAQAMGDMMAGALRGSVAGTTGFVGDISDISRTLAPDAMQTVFGPRVMPTTEEMNKMLLPAVPQNASASRKHTAETFGALGEFMPTPMSGTAAKALSYGLGRGAGALTRGAGKMVNDAMVYNQGPLAQGSLSFLAPRTATMNVVKPEGGNWLGGNLAGGVDKRLESLKTETVAGQTPAERIPLHERALQDPAINDDGRAIIQRHLDITKGEAAVDKWIENNIGNYVKKQMATPSDPVRLMLEKRSQEIEAQFQVDMNRAERTRARAEAEPDPRRQANLMRQAAQQEEQAKFDRDFANEHVTHLPKEDRDWGNIDEDALSDLKSKREKAGFDPEGMAKSAPAQQWENITDEAVGSNRAGDIQKQQAMEEQSKQANLAYDKIFNQIEERYSVEFRKELEERGVTLNDQQFTNIIKSTPITEKASYLGLDDQFQKLRQESFNADRMFSSGLQEIGEENPFVSKLDPETKLYSGYLGDLGFDHIVDVIRQDVAAGRIRPDQLNKLSVDQAVRRTADFNAEQAKKMAETQIKATEGFPVHKEYPEGYKWIELKAPAKELPTGWTVREAKSPISGERYQQVYNEQNNEIVGAYGRTKEEALKGLGRSELESALKYEGDTMGHCVGGYCPDVISGKSKIYSLRDKRGEPHVTVEVRPNEHLDYNDWFSKQPEEVQNRIAQRRVEDKNHDIYEGPEYLADRAALAPRIIQIKGKQNRAPKEQYLPYVQDFVRGGNWSDVGDIRNAGLIRQDGNYMTQAEYDDYLLNVLKHPPEDGMKKGGKVSISDNCDCQHMEVMDKHMAGGGALSKAAIEALERMKALKPEFQARVNLQNKYKAETVGLPYNEVKPFQMTNEQIREEMDRMAREQAQREQSKGKGGAVEKLIKLARAPAKTKAEIEAIAQRIAPQMTGEYVRASDKTAKTVAGKTQKQFEREKTLEHDIRPTEGVERPLPKDVDIESLKGNVMMGISGDPTITGQTIYSINGVPLRSPAPQHGGPLYGLGKEDEFWASNLGAAQGVQNRAKGLSELYESPVVGNYVKMGPDSYSYAQHFADTNLQNIRPELMTKKQIEGFNKLVRQGSLKSGPRPSFPGIENPEEAYLHFAVDPELRKHFGNLMQMPTVTEKFGLPSGQDVAHAVTEPDLRNLEIGVTGKSLGLMKPDVTDLKLSSHPTYSHDIPGQFLGGMKYPVPHDLMFPDTLKSVRENPAQAPQEFGSFKMVGPRQVIDQQMIDEIKQYQDMIKKYTGKKKGGKVKKMAEGGEITGDDLILEERPL